MVGTAQQPTEQNTAGSQRLDLQDTLPTFMRNGGGIVGSTPPTLVLTPFDSYHFEERTVVRPDQIEFCIDKFKGLIPQLVQQNRSPFIHYGCQSTPPVIYQDLLGVSAMYCQKTPQNQAITFSMLNSRVASLIESSATSSWLVSDIMEAVQAMLMYQIIRLFDGDVRQRANGERHLKILETWTFQLESISNGYINDLNMESSYQRWVFIESARRTVLMSTMVSTIYSLLKTGYCTSVPKMSALPMSVNGELWNSSEESWWQTTLGFGGELVTYQDFTNQWSRGEMLYTDTFETILLAACRHNLRGPPFMPMLE